MMNARFRYDGSTWEVEKGLLTLQSLDHLIPGDCRSPKGPNVIHKNKGKYIAMIATDADCMFEKSAEMTPTDTHSNTHIRYQNLSI